MRYRSDTSLHSINPPWPEPQDMAPDATTPSMDSRESFVEDAVSRFNDDEFFAAERWNTARRLLTDGDMHGGPAASELKPIHGSSFPAEKMPGMTSPGPQALTSSSPEYIRVLAAWLLTPREAFIPSAERQAAYLPNALPIGHGQTISAPYMVTRMTAFLNPSPSDSVLEIGTGSGYQAAILASLCGHIRTIEYVGPLAAETGRIFDNLEKHRPWLQKIRRKTGNGYSGWEEGAPYDRIIVTCAIDHVPQSLIEQLAPGGILVLPLGQPRVQELIAIRKRRNNEERSPGASWHPSREVSLLKLPLGYDAADVYGNGTRVVFVPFVY